MVVLALLCIFFLVVGIVTLGWPEKIQEYALHFYANAKGMAGWNPFEKWMRTSSYILSLRIIGMLAIFVAFVALYTLVKKI